MKAKYLFAGLVTSMTLGAAIMAGAVFGKESKVLKRRANAAVSLDLPAVSSSLKRVFLDMSGFKTWYDTDKTVSFQVHSWGSEERWTSAIKADDYFWYADVDLVNQTGYQFVRSSADGQTHHNYSSNANPLSNNYCHINEWNNSSNWKTVSMNWSIKGGSDGESSWGDIDIPFSTSKLDKDGLQIYSQTISFNQGNVFKVNGENNEWLGFNKCTSYDGESANEKGYITGNGDSNITVTKTGIYEVYVKPYDETIWIQLSSETEANDYGKLFIESMTCSGQGSITAENGTWTNMSTSYSHLTSGAKDLLVAAEGNETGSYIEQCVTRYDEIIKKYGTIDYPDFMNRFEEQSSGSRALISTPTTEASVPATVVVVGMVSLTAVGGFFFIKKKPF